jgi:dihydroorotate dehydrogenase
MYQFIRPLLFHLDAEQAHNLTLALLRIAGNFPLTNFFLSKLFQINSPCLEIKAFGIRFENPVGLAAGYDKNGVAIRGLGCLGFGHIEVGTLTRFAQAGNPRPRIHRVPGSRALINSMGFPNAGVDRLRVYRESTRVGINIGKGKDTPLERAAEDYCELLKRVHPQADYVTINVSSPNTPGLRQLQSRSAINDLLQSVTSLRDDLIPRAPLLVKISPDLSEAEIDNVLTAVQDNGADGIIATNTTTTREGVPKIGRASCRERVS